MPKIFGTIKLITSGSLLCLMLSLVFYGGWEYASEIVRTAVPFERPQRNLSLDEHLEAVGLYLLEVEPIEDRVRSISQVLFWFLFMCSLARVGYNLINSFWADLSSFLSVRIKSIQYSSSLRKAEKEISRVKALHDHGIFTDKELDERKNEIKQNIMQSWQERNSER